MPTIPAPLTHTMAIAIATSCYRVPTSLLLLLLLLLPSTPLLPRMGLLPSLPGPFQDEFPFIVHFGLGGFIVFVPEQEQRPEFTIGSPNRNRLEIAIEPGVPQKVNK